MAAQSCWNRPRVLMAMFLVVYLLVTWANNFRVSRDIFERTVHRNNMRMQENREPDVHHVALDGAKVVDADSYFHSLGRKDRVYCMLPSMYSENRFRLWKAVLKTWGPRCDVIKFFVDPSPDPIPSTFSVPGGMSADIVIVPMKRKSGGMCSDNKPCRHIWEKVWRSWDWVAANDLDKAEWFFKIDDDTYFIPSNVRKFTRERNWNPDDPYYFGHQFYQTESWTLISGVCTGFSREAIRRLGKRFETIVHEYGDRSKFPDSHGICVDRDGATEERVTSKCLMDMNVTADPTLEDGKRVYVIPLGIPFTLTYKRKPTTTSWYWYLKPQSRGDENECCSVYAWGIHGYKSSRRMIDMETAMSVTPASELVKRAEVARETYSETQSKLEIAEEESKRKKDLLKQSQEAKDEEAFYRYILKLRTGIAEDEYAYPKMKNPL
mmetsp:Transcript_5195/g.7950  ORF Transcript_5195/g.7950 Transcript_5195/m.7950 type:complete len:436 (+) Transcript_5195:441-1748(+)